MSAPLNDRPVPLRDAFRSVGAFIALLGGVVTSLAGWGVLTAAQGDAVTGLLGAVPGVVTLATALLAAFGVVKTAEPQVTPVADPASYIDGELVPLYAAAPTELPPVASGLPAPAGSDVTGAMHAVAPSTASTYVPGGRA